MKKNSLKPRAGAEVFLKFRNRKFIDRKKQASKWACRGPGKNKGGIGAVR